MNKDSILKETSNKVTQREKNYPGETNKKKAIYWLIEADRLDVRVVYKPDHLSTSLRSTPL